MKYAVIKDNQVVNIIQWDGISTYTPPNNHQLVLIVGEAAIGWDYIDEEFINNSDIDEGV